MELQGLYELHERLGAAAVAGVNLIGDDFRLRRAVEQIRPLAQAVPVIKKLYTMAENVMAPASELIYNTVDTEPVVTAIWEKGFFRTPDFYFTYSFTGKGQASRNFHDWAQIGRAHV